MRSIASIKTLRVALALVVALWMAGAGCMLGCENMISTAAAQEAGSLESSSNGGASRNSSILANASISAGAGDSCPSMHSHDCCAKHGAHGAAKVTVQVASNPATKSAGHATQHTMTSAALVIAEFNATSPMMMDCPLAVNATAALSKARPDLSSLSLTPSSVRDSLPNYQAQTTALSTPPRLPNRGHTYLRCCVFLI